MQCVHYDLDYYNQLVEASPQDDHENIVPVENQEDIVEYGESSSDES